MIIYIYIYTIKPFLKIPPFRPPKVFINEGLLRQGTIEEACYVEVVDVMWVIPIYDIVKLLPAGQDIWLILEFARDYSTFDNKMIPTIHWML